MISVGKDRVSHELIERSGEFGLNTVSERQKNLADYCGHASLKDHDKFREKNIPIASAKKIKAPLLRESPSCLECRVVSVQDCGDHTIFLGEVIASHRSEGRPVGICGDSMVKAQETGPPIAKRAA
jgi:flavin reductase (DIM6/NTAB) family NADH-FMN oxidoreductase RutF